MTLGRDARVLIGGFTDGASGGVPSGLAVHRVTCDGMVHSEGALALENPTWITSAGRPGLFYVSHSARRTLSAVTVDGDGGLSLIDQIDIGHVNPAHVALAPSGDAVVAACFTAGVVVRVTLSASGGFGAVERVWDLNDAAATATRRNRLQSEAEPHQSVVDDAGGVLVPDRAQDVVWRIGADDQAHPAVVLRPGSGPRHLALHASEPYAYLVGELDSTLTTLRRAGSGIEPVDVQTTLPRSWVGDSAAAAIAIDSGRERVYVSNRGHDAIAVFDTRAPERPELIGWIPVQGRTPRFAGMLPGLDAFAIAAQASDRVDLMDAADAAALTGGRVSIVHAAPSCVVEVRG